MLEQRIGEIRKECGQFEDPFMRYTFVSELSVYLPKAEESLRSDTYRIRDCQSNVWLKKEIRGGCFYLEADSDALIMRGILYILGELYNGCPAEEIAETDADILELCGLKEMFAASRNKGIRSLCEGIRRFCRNYLENQE